VTVQIKRPVGQEPIAAGVTRSIELPKDAILGAIEIHVGAVFTTTAGAITVVDSTLGVIPLITNIQLVLDGRAIPLSCSARFLDIWSHIDRPGSERLATSSTVSGDQWDTVLRYELGQAVHNLTGALRLPNYATARLDITFGALSLVASGTGLAVGGNVTVYNESYDPTQIVADHSVIHTLTATQYEVSATGTNLTRKLAKGRALERLIVIPENNGVLGVWTMLSNLGLRLKNGDEPYIHDTPVFRAAQLRHYGGDDVPITGVYVFDFRQSGDRDVIPLGDLRQAPEPEIVFTTSGALVNAKLHVLAEELAAVQQPAAMAA
jgi:hypothetical protein